MSIPPLPPEPLEFEDAPSQETPFAAAVVNPWGKQVHAIGEAARTYALSAQASAAEAGALDDQAMANVFVEPATASREILDGLYGADSTAATPRALSKLIAGLAAREDTPCRVVFCGDSFTSANTTPEAARYVNRITAMIQAAYPSGTAVDQPVITSATATWGTLSTAPGVHAYNAGISGAWSENYITGTTLPLIAALQPAMVVHMIGVTDYRDDHSPADYKANLESNIAALKAEIAVPHVHVLIRPYRPTDEPDPAYPWDEYGQAQQEIADADPQNVIYIDLNPAWESAGVPDGGDPYDLFSADNLHMTDLGHGYMAELIRRGLGLPLVLTPTWQAYIPTLTSTTLGTGGSVVARYRRTGASIRVRFLITLGTGGSFSGAPSVSLPAPQNTTAMGTGTPLGTVAMVDGGSGGTRTLGVVLYLTESSVYFIHDRAGSGYTSAATVAAASPWTWASGDTLAGEFEYEAA